MFRIIRNSRIPKILSVFMPINAIALYPFIFLKDDGEERVISHELIHIAQQKELFIIGFYLLYVYYWVKGLLKGKGVNMAYLEIPFEVEAYKNENKRIYFMYREKYAWKKYR